jgi:molybdopterin molybdotransferase
MLSEVAGYATVEDALKLVMKGMTARRIETAHVRSAFGRVSAEDVVSSVDVPDSSRSHMDGYALRSRDLKGASEGSPRNLSLVGVKTLGDAERTRLRSGETIRVPTGGVMPLGADAVVPVEDARKRGRAVTFTREWPKGSFVFQAGTDMKKGRVVLRAGQKIRAQDVGMLIVLGVVHPRVFAKPRVAIIATGSELTDDFSEADPSKVRNSHSQIFVSLVREAGGEPVDMGVVPDSLKPLSAAIRSALAGCDLVLTLGGTSLGEADLVGRAIESMGNDVRSLHGIRMDRGRVTGVALVDGKPVVMMPGPVQGAMNGFVLFALPAMSALSGRQGVSERGLPSTLTREWRARRRFRDFVKVVYVRLRIRGGRLLATPLAGDTESMALLVAADGYIVLPERVQSLRAGTRVVVKAPAGFSSLG